MGARLSRREVLAAGGAMAMGALSLDFSGSKRSVTVIGAGAAGLAAAAALAEAGCGVVVLEGRDRIGGRIWTDRSLGVPFDKGASWIHGSRGSNPVAALARQAGAKTYATDDDSLALYFSDGRQADAAEVTAAIERFDQAMTDAEEKGEVGRSIEQLLSQAHPDLADDELVSLMLTSWMEFDLGAPVSRVSSAVFDEDSSFPGPDSLIVGGADAVVQELAKGLDIRLNERVISVSHGSGETVVVASSGEYRADFCVCTLPLGVLKAGQVAFDPPLGMAKVNAMGRLGMGCANKMLLLWDEAFWPPEIEAFAIAGPQPGAFRSFLNGVPPFGAPVLMTFALGEFAEPMEAREDAENLAQALANLRLMFGAEVPEPKAFALTRWRSDPWTLGAYSYPGVEARNGDFDALGRPEGSRLHFAGEHTISRYRATMHGAILSGRRAAAEILAV